MSSCCHSHTHTPHNSLRYKQVSTALSGKEELVIKGLDASRRSIDDFLAFFPAADVEKAKAVVEQENQLNIKEFDTKALGALLNLPKP